MSRPKRSFHTDLVHVVLLEVSLLQGNWATDLVSSQKKTLLDPKSTNPHYKMPVVALVPVNAGLDKLCSLHLMMSNDCSFLVLERNIGINQVQVPFFRMPIDTL